VSELLNEKRCVLQGIETGFGIVSPLDLELSRMLHPNDIPVARSHFIEYASINKLMSVLGGGNTSFGYEELLNKMGANQDRLDKLVNDYQHSTSIHFYGKMLLIIIVLL
jgi:hypothetical protein